MLQKKKLVFENGAVFHGTGFGADASRVCEVVFHTAMAGYQEVFSDPGYSGQLVCMTYPLIGNYGLAEEDYEAHTPALGGFIVREYNDSLANFRAAKTLSEDMAEHGIPGIEGVDTRRITRMLRDGGSMRAMLCDEALPESEALRVIAQTPAPHGQMEHVSCKKRWYARTARQKYNVALIDCGVKLGVVDSLKQRRCNVTVLPYHTTADEVLALAPGGLLLCGGPGAPEEAAPVIALTRALRGKLPIMGICTGHLILALAYGCRTYKLKCGHRGGNHPVRDVRTGRVVMTSQNHGYAVDAPSVAGSGLSVTHVNLLDGTVEGLCCETDRLFGVQFRPESRPGPQDAACLFDVFLQNMGRAAR